jgi:hypothetical protein
MTTTSQIPAVTDWLVNAATVSTSLGASPSAPVVIHDGPAVTTDTLIQPLHLWIGWDQVTGGGAGASAVQGWPVLDRARTRDEDGVIVCTADAWSGVTVTKTQRDSCAAVVSAVELLLRGGGVGTDPGDASMGGLVLWSAVDGPYEWYPRQTPEGAGCACVFRITYRARLVTS